MKTAYLHKASGGKDRTGGYVLTICDRPCSGDEFQAGEKIEVINKREARKICAALDARPHNF